MNLDWILGLVVFLTFTAWALGFYFSIYNTGPPDGLDAAATSIKNDVVAFLTAEVHQMPVRFNSSSSQSGAVLYAVYSWPFGKNSAKVLSGSTSLPCRFSGDTIYWQADLSPGFNYFTIKYADMDASLNCNSTFDISSANQTKPWSAEKKTMFLQEKIDNMTATPYSGFRASLDINRNFRLEMDINGTTTVYGPSAPQHSDVFVKETAGTIYENDKTIELRIMVW
jgi:hypothetical protein